MSVQIDMTKFLESLVDDKNGFHQLTVLDILYALNSMGLTIGFNGKIERIVAEPKQVPEGWYVCKKAFSYPKLDGYLPVFVEGESTPKEKVFAAIPYMTEKLFNEHFRPATEEETMAIVSIKPEPLSPAPQRNNYDEIKQAEPKQEWSEEDEETLKGIIYDISCVKRNNIDKTNLIEVYDKELNWLNSIKKRFVSENKQGWDENDEARLTDILCKVKDDLILNKDEKDWLKSLKDRCLLQPKQEDSPILSNSSNTAKNDELTDFEKSVRDIITSELCTNFSDMSFGISISDEEARLIAKKLLQASRKQITGEIDVDAMIAEHHFYNGGKGAGYKIGIEDVLKKVKEG